MTIATVAAVATALIPQLASAQSGSPQPTTPAAVSNPFAPKPGVKRVPVSKTVFGDAGVIINARDDGYIEIAAAGPSKTVLLQLRTLAARAWVDSASRMMKARVKRSDPPRAYRADISEYGTNGKMTFTRSVENAESQYTLAFTDDTTPGFSFPIENEEAEVFVAVVRKAVAQSAKLLEKSDTSAVKADSAAKDDSTAKPKKKKKPAAKPQAPPPAKPDSGKPNP